MAQKLPDSPKKHRPKFSGCFLACFRSSRSPEKASKKGSWLISWSTKSPKKAFVEEKMVIKKKESFRVAKLGKKFSSSNHDRGSPVNSSAPPGLAPAAAGGGDEVVHRQPDKKTIEEKNQEEIFPEKGNVNPANKEKKWVIFNRNSSLPAADKIGPVLLHSASMPPLAAAGKQPTATLIGGASERENGAFEQLIGMSIIVVTLLIMVMWGKVCAIFCTSAWLYFYPNIVRATKLDQPKRTKSLDFDNKSEAKKLKKKVVFEGFLERSHRG